MDLDLAQVRAFVAVVDHGHFGRAAESLTLTQQALSKRVARLEQRLGRLLERRRGGVVPTPAGERFLPAARELLALADDAVLALRESPPPPLRVDVWSEIQMPAALIREIGRALPDLRLELSTRRDLSDAVRALQRRELDLAFGNVAGLGRPLPRGLTAEPIADEPIAVLVNARGPFGRHARVRPEELAPHGLWWPMSGSSAELRAVVEGYAAAIGAPLIDAGSNLGLEALVDRIAAEPAMVSPVAASWPLPARAGVRRVALEPAPRFTWSAVWRTGDPHPALPRVLRALTPPL
jgi:DNA-binding transcriptional LysR family regulator